MCVTSKLISLQKPPPETPSNVSSKTESSTVPTPILKSLPGAVANGTAMNGAAIHA